MTLSRLPPGLLDLVPPPDRFVPPVRLLDKPICSPLLSTTLRARLRRSGIDTLVVSGGETVMGAIDYGHRVIIVTDASAAPSIPPTMRCWRSTAEGVADLQLSTALRSEQSLSHSGDRLFRIHRHEEPEDQAPVLHGRIIFVRNRGLVEGQR